MSVFLIDICEIHKENGYAALIEKEGVILLGDCGAAVKLYGTVEKNDSAYYFKGSIKGNLKSSCARCLAPVSLPYDTEIEFCFSNSENIPDDTETLIFKGSTVDFEPVISGTVRADMPISVLCNEDCRGLCEVCGNDLNADDCGCLKDLLNPVINKDIFDIK